MTNQQIYNYIDKKVLEHISRNGNEYIADEYVKEGYGQTEGEYFNYAKKNKIDINPSVAEPNQKWHLLVSYYDYKVKFKKFNMNTSSSLERIYCPQLMLWIAEVAGLNIEALKEAKRKAIIFEKEKKCTDCKFFNSNKFFQNLKKEVLVESLHWYEIMQALREEENWNNVLNRVEKLHL